MNTNELLPVVGYTDQQHPLHLSENLNFALEQTHTLEEFINRMMKGDCSGLILDIRKVMAEDPLERNRIFAIAAGYPILRTKVDKHGNQIFIDSPDVFQNFCNGVCRTNVREDERVEININASISCEADPAMANSIDVRLKNISLDGCFIETEEDLSSEQFIHLRIPELSNRLPILAGIRWYTGQTHEHKGVGAKFVKILDEQRAEIADLFLK